MSCLQLCIGLLQFRIAICKRFLAPCWRCLRIYGRAERSVVLRRLAQATFRTHERDTVQCVTALDGRRSCMNGRARGLAHRLWRRIRTYETIWSRSLHITRRAVRIDVAKMSDWHRGRSCWRRLAEHAALRRFAESTFRTHEHIAADAYMGRWGESRDLRNAAGCGVSAWRARGQTMSRLRRRWRRLPERTSPSAPRSERVLSCLAHRVPHESGRMRCSPSFSRLKVSWPSTMACALCAFVITSSCARCGLPVCFCAIERGVSPR